MDDYKTRNMGDLAGGNPYWGRGIVIGKAGNSAKAVIAYFIMGRSENSRNRIFVKEGEELFTCPFEKAKVSDSSLIIYRAIVRLGNNLIVTNGDHTDSIYTFINAGKSFEAALETRTFEPDFPNFTPRISGTISFMENDFRYKMSILKCLDGEGNICGRYFYNYEPEDGVGHFIHTYDGDGEPLPAFIGEPKRICIPENIDDFTGEIWEGLNYDNKISLYVRYTDIYSGEYEDRLINKNRRLS